jgi:hypothetical protein
MKVRDLIAHLQDEDPDANVILSGDAEGNRLGTWAGYTDSYKYIEEDGEIWLLDADDTEHDDWKLGVVLWPV